MRAENFQCCRRFRVYLSTYALSFVNEFFTTPARTRQRPPGNNASTAVFFVLDGPFRVPMLVVARGSGALRALLETGRCLCELAVQRHAKGVG